MQKEIIKKFIEHKLHPQKIGNFVSPLTEIDYWFIFDNYISAEIKTEDIAKKFNISSRQIQRIIKQAEDFSEGELKIRRSVGEANKVSSKFKKYYKMSEEVKEARKWVSRAMRYEIIAMHPFCANCGLRTMDGVRLEVDHIDNDPKNNNYSNFQVLCHMCNIGKFKIYDRKRKDCY